MWASRIYIRWGLSGSTSWSIGSLGVSPMSFAILPIKTLQTAATDFTNGSPFDRWMYSTPPFR